MRTSLSAMDGMIRVWMRFDSAERCEVCNAPFLQCGSLSAIAASTRRVSSSTFMSSTRRRYAGSMADEKLDLVKIQEDMLENSLALCMSDLPRDQVALVPGTADQRFLSTAVQQL